MSIRVKMVLLLTVVAVLPLTVAVVAIAAGGARLRIVSVGQSLQSASASAAMGLAAALAADIDKLHVAMEHTPGVTRAVAAPRKLLSAARRAELDRQWATLPTDSGVLGEVLHNPVADQLALLMRDDERLAEILVTDRHGQLIAATQRTTDFDQADEDWWTQCTADPSGRIVIPPIGFDESSRVYSIDICMPVCSPADGRVIGAVKAVLNLSPWLRELHLAWPTLPASVLLMRADGTVLHHLDPAVPPDAQPAGPRPQVGPVDVDAPPSWRVTRDGFIVACAPVPKPRAAGGRPIDMSPWVLVKYLPEGQALGAVYRLAGIVLGGGLLIVAVIFVVGLYLAERGLVHRIRAMAAATKRVAEGDLMHRLQRRRHRSPLGNDEIDDLTEDFNRMVEKVHRSYTELKAADDLKANFIRIAGHEFRTPISYILGVGQLLKDSKDPEKLLQAIQTVGAKAKRLDEITQAMFKLMPESPTAEAMQVEDVDLAELLAEVRLDVLPFLAQRNQDLILRITRDVTPIRADRGKVRDVITNLVTNAIKFTPDGGEVGVDVSRRSPQTVAIAVSDQGPGIPDEELPHIFEPFFSGTDVLTHSSGDAGYMKRGIGLGLTIVKYFVELHGGTVHVSTGAWGSIFTVEIPVAPQARRWTEEVQI
ncbi:MAG: ATP-binding protein [Phycisphaerae bacterium]|nr:ATP-binding protein [Phycisphaerae bacterium]